MGYGWARSIVLVDDRVYVGGDFTRTVGEGGANKLAMYAPTSLSVRGATSGKVPFEGFQVAIAGTGFDLGIRAYIGNDATPWPTLVRRSDLSVVLAGTGLKRRFPKGAPVGVRLVNPDGGEATVTVIR
jgi:hypothetical protein